MPVRVPPKLMTKVLPEAFGDDSDGAAAAAQRRIRGGHAQEQVVQGEREGRGAVAFRQGGDDGREAGEAQGVGAGAGNAERLLGRVIDAERVDVLHVEDAVVDVRVAGVGIDGIGGEAQGARAGLGQSRRDHGGRRQRRGVGILDGTGDRQRRGGVGADGAVGLQVDAAGPGVVAADVFEGPIAGAAAAVELQGVAGERGDGGGRRGGDRRDDRHAGDDRQGRAIVGASVKTVARIAERAGRDS